MIALFVGGMWHGQIREVSPDSAGRWPGVVEGYLYWPAETWWANPIPCYLAPGADQADLDRAVVAAGSDLYRLRSCAAVTR